jgi:hypothetical protein
MSRKPFHTLRRNNEMADGTFRVDPVTLAGEGLTRVSGADSWMDGVAEAGADDDWMNAASGGAGTGVEAEGDWMAELTEEDNVQTAEMLLAAPEPVEEPASTTPQEALDPSRAKHLAKAKKRAEEEERRTEMKMMAISGEMPLDDPEAERERLERLQEEKNLEMAADAFGLTGDDDEEEEDGKDASSKSTAMPDSLADCVKLLPIRGAKGWDELAESLMARAIDDKSKLTPGKLIKGLLRAAIAEDVVSVSDIKGLQDMLKLAETNAEIAADKQRKGMGKKKKASKQPTGGFAGKRTGGGAADMMGLGGGGSAVAMMGSFGDDDFM